MSEANTPRLMAAAKEFNVGKDTLIDVLVSKGFSGDDLKPTSKITEDMYRVLQLEFQQDKVAKQKAEQIDLPKNATAESKKKRDEEDISIRKKEAAKIKETPAQPAPSAVEEIKEDKKEQQAKTTIEAAPAIEAIPSAPEITNIEAPEIEQPKVVDKIDLSTIDSTTRPKKGQKKKEEEPKTEVAKKSKKKDEPPVEEPKPITEITEPEPPKNEPAVIENIKADKLEGPKIMGKIDLPVNNETRARTHDEKRKRKRIPVDQKKVGNSPQSNFQRTPTVGGGGAVVSRPYQGNRPHGGAGAGRFNRNAPAVARRDEKEM